VSPFDRSRLGILFALCLGGCQPLDTGAALGEPYSNDSTGTDSAFEGSGIELADGETPASGCEALQIQAHDILETNCARCHGGDNPGARQGTPPFDCVLDPERMVSMVSATAKDPDTLQPARFLKPGDPDHSRIYLRPYNGEMPPPDVIGLPPNPRPSVSDLSVLRQWIASCVPDTDTVDDNADDHDNEQDGAHDTTHGV
jgi:hypothetical protein